MAVTIYQCSVCDRQIEIFRNPKSVDVINNCVITQNCRGTMIAIKNLDDYSRGRNPKSVSGLEDWNQRKVLFNFVQTTETDSWIIKHDMQCFPEVMVYANKPTENDAKNVVKIEPQKIELVDQNSIRLSFERPQSGTAQLFTNTSFPDSSKFVARSETIKNVQLTNNGELTIAVIKFPPHRTIINLSATWIFPSGKTTPAIFKVDDVQSINSPWRTFTEVVINGVVYELRSFLIRDFNVPTGSHVNFTGMDPSLTDELEKNQLFSLISNPPFQIFDIDRYRALDLSDLISDPLSLSFDGFELSVKSDKLKNIFPPISDL